MTTGPAGDAERPAPRRPSGVTVRFDDAEPLTVVLVRHGVTEMTVAGAFSGSGEPGPSLTAAGRVQAAQAADLVHRIGRTAWTDLPRASAVVASPIVRTQETAAAVGRRLGVPVRTDARFAEIHFGAYEGLRFPDVEERGPGWLERFYRGGDVAAPGGESLADVGERVWDGLRALRDEGTGRTVVVVTHAMAVRAAVGRAFGSPPAQWTKIRITPASVTILRLWPDGETEATVVGCPPDL
ncbi:MAG TPA: histidine phosphatase family protein [Luteimicrobium sp.]|nr:histidine phosphatase family protein [Luteimicrobium sp.]